MRNASRCSSARAASPRAKLSPHSSRNAASTSSSSTPRATARKRAIIARAGEVARITIATNMAGRGTDIKLAPEVTALGGLHVILTEIHDAGRIDRQLIGRAARQGDPGSAQAFASMEDELAARHLPTWLRQQTASALARRVPGAHAIAGKLIARAQTHAEQVAFTQRRLVLEADTRTEQLLSFTGAEVVEG